MSFVQSQKKRVGIFGGTFDPPHHGHLILAECALYELALDEIIFAPVGAPPHKLTETRITTDQRVEMTRIAIADNPHFKLSLADVNRPAPHFTVDLLKILHHEMPDDTLVFLMGADSLHDLPHWDRPSELVLYAELGVMNRMKIALDYAMLESYIPGITARVFEFDAPLIEISSTDIVARLRKGQSARYLLPDSVLEYIHQSKLYQE